MTRLLLIAGLIAGMEACRIGWHGRWRCHPMLCALQIAAIAGLRMAGTALEPWALLSCAAALASYLTLLWRDDPTPRLWQARVTLWLGRPMWMRERRHPWSALRFPWSTPGPDRWHGLSMLSALPIQVAAVLAVCWPLPGWQRWAALAAFAAEGVVIKRWLWTWGRLVPQHWR